jgi:hypothetical protein
MIRMFKGISAVTDGDSVGKIHRSEDGIVNGAR